MANIQIDQLLRLQEGIIQRLDALDNRIEIAEKKEKVVEEGINLFILS